MQRIYTPLALSGSEVTRLADFHITVRLKM